MSVEIHIPNEPGLIIKNLNSNGYEAYIVGGCVRDFLMEKQPNDWDICTNALPDTVCDIFSDYQLIKNGLKHGTVGIIINNSVYEVTTFRTEGEYNDNRHPNRVSFVSDIESDLKRRDFTVNSMAYNFTTGLIDPYGGLEDIKNKIIRCVGTPDERFEEDALRIIRAIRFSAVLGFDIDDDTKNSIIKNRHLLKNIAVERIRTEFEKILASDNLKVYYEYNTVFEIFTKSNNVSVKLSKMLSSLPSSIPLRLTAYILSIYENDSDIYNRAQCLMKSLRFDNKTTARVLGIIKNYDMPLCADMSFIRAQIGKIGYSLFTDLLYIKSQDSTLKDIRKLYNEIISKRLCCTVSELKINGDDLIKNGIKAGKQIGCILDKLIKYVINDKVKNTKSDLIKKAKEINSLSEE